jgi:hypothetical protein
MLQNFCRGPYHTGFTTPKVSNPQIDPGLKGIPGYAGLRQVVDQYYKDYPGLEKTLTLPVQQQ